MLPLFSEEAFSETVAGLLRVDNGVVVWWGAWIECAVAISRLRREGKLDDEGQEEARDPWTGSPKIGPSDVPRTTCASWRC